ncbi:MAG: serine hydrolase [Bacteroidota bacterium]
MSINKLLFLPSFFFLSLSTFAQQKNILQDLLEQNAELKTIFNQPEKYQAQVIYTQIDRDENNVPAFTSYQVGVDENRYHYPASTVKMPAAFLALEKINELKIINLTKETPMLTGTGRPPQTPALNDPSAKNNLPSVAHYAKKIFLVSDNDAFNRLYEFLGQQYFNEKLQEKGFDHSRVWHRLSVSGFDVEGNRYTNPVSFLHNNELLYYQGQRYSFDAKQWELKDAVRGKARMTNEGETINEPFDFRYKNFISVQDLHDLLKTVLFPESVPEKQRFNLTAEDYEFLYRVMSTFPKESNYPRYKNKEDNYVKFFIYGDNKDTIPDHIRIFNKVGWAYGFLTDVSYIIDFERNIEFMVTASIHVNENQTYNDGEYEYETIGLPYFGNLGRMLYEYEQRRQRKYAPDLSKFDVEHY